ncbi:unannotated protein [freshwater metagenome]|uniref:Unannotated protein n=1 Tax=freshwater metagenome TaxID=449393 RepID=A0A6J7AKA2_9ZZZZ
MMMSGIPTVKERNAIGTAANHLLVFPGALESSCAVGNDKSKVIYVSPLCRLSLFLREYSLTQAPSAKYTRRRN